MRMVLAEKYIKSRRFFHENELRVENENPSCKRRYVSDRMGDAFTLEYERSEQNEASDAELVSPWWEA